MQQITIIKENDSSIDNILPMPESTIKKQPISAAQTVFNLCLKRQLSLLPYLPTEAREKEELCIEKMLLDLEQSGIDAKASNELFNNYKSQF